MMWESNVLPRHEKRKKPKKKTRRQRIKDIKETLVLEAKWLESQVGREFPVRISPLERANARHWEFGVEHAFRSMVILTNGKASEFPQIPGRFQDIRVIPRSFFFRV